MSDEVRRVVIYARVSSDSQRERQTVLTQLADLERHLSADPNIVIDGKYIDDGVGGPVPLSERPAGQRLLTDAQRGLFDEVWMFKVDRLGRDDIDPLVVRRELERFGVRLLALHENLENPLEFAIRVAFAAEERRQFLVRTGAGMRRAAENGRYCGGIIPIGFKVDGFKQTARLVPSDVMIWGDWTEADLVRHIYRRLAVDHWSCRRVSDELNDLRVPTAYQKDGREVAPRKGERRRATQGKWRSGRIRNLVINPVYKGLLQYGRRSAKKREILSATSTGLVSEEIWNAAQETLARNRMAPKNSWHTYLLRSKIICGTCGLHYCGSRGRGVTWYRCDGQMVERGPLEGRCPSKSIKGDVLEPVVWSYIETFIRDPGKILDEFVEEVSDGAASAVAEADLTTLNAALDSVSGQKDRILDLFRKELISEADVEVQLKKIADEEQEIRQRLDALDVGPTPQADPVQLDLLSEIRSRLPNLDAAQRQEIVSLLVDRIVINTEFLDGKKEVKAIVHYRFPAVDETFTGRGSLPLPS